MNAYQESGVNVYAGYEAVEKIKPLVKETFNKNVLNNLGDFNALYELPNIKNPVLVSGTDGVGTKLKLAFSLNNHITIGQDCVAMCVNDILCSGAQPLFFLDYIACGKNNPSRIAEIVSGIAQACKLAQTSLIGGETAEMPGFYQPDEYDLAGFTCGVVSKEKIISKKDIKAGNILIALPSTGIHSNGFSLVRKIIEEKDLNLNKIYPGLGEKTLGEILLTPTEIYVKPILALLKEFELNGICHITGGGLIENVPRMIPDGLGAKIVLKDLKTPPIFDFLKKEGNLTNKDMLETFNMGVGMIVAIPKEDQQAVLETLEKLGQKAYPIGIIEDSKEKIKFV